MEDVDKPEAAASASSPIDLRRLSQFVAVADHGSLTRAAHSLFISQQAMSAAMRQLEKQIGTALFTPHGRSLVLTAAGHKLREGAPTLLAAAESLAAATRHAAQDQAPAFVVAHTPAITAEEAFDLIAPIRRAAPEASITVRQMFLDDIERGLFDQTVDVGLRRGVSRPPDLASAVIGYNELRIAIDAAHPLTERPHLTLADIAGYTLIVWAPPMHSFYTDFLISSCRRAGFEPTHTVNPIQGTPPVTAVAGNNYVALVTAPLGPALGGTVIVKSLTDAPKVPLQAIWLPHTTSRPRDALLGS
ncbi:LysR family transcriptional regulator [Rhodococcus qingshengii]|uniref:LysR family transcriptional regulator n=1 Tax=Rhodococcus qingshengii TaxID=334542 RepID=A0AAW6LPW4_RHOSG|nr:LysR family transcriptional regulator [Rhodococcus qingshengii]MDE8649682.1 LysR family transcriptional regulator [Rhodococcus qingshengii]